MTQSRAHLEVDAAAMRQQCGGNATMHRRHRVDAAAMLQRCGCCGAQAADTVSADDQRDNRRVATAGLA
jgi:hypothetical protein